MPKKQSECCDYESRRQTTRLATCPPGDRGVDAMFKAFSDGTRLRILHLLLGGEMCVGDLASIVEATQPRASQHLACLRTAGLVTCRRQGLWSYYTLARPATTFHKKLLECLRHCFSEVPEIQADGRRAAKLATAAPCCPATAPRRRIPKAIR